MTAVKAAKTLPLQDGFFSAHLGATDPELADAIRGELRRQQDQIELIASENVVSLAVLEAQGSVLTNKYAEGYPHRRYYGRSEEHTSELQSLMRISYAVLCLKKKKNETQLKTHSSHTQH